MVRFIFQQQNHSYSFESLPKSHCKHFSVICDCKENDDINHLCVRGKPSTTLTNPHRSYENGKHFFYPCKMKKIEINLYYS